MSLNGGINQPVKDSALSLPWRTVANLAMGLRRLARAPRTGAPPVLRWSPSRMAAAFLLTVLVLILIMAAADVAAINASQRLPNWLVWAFNEITDFGRSGWFLFPLGVLLLASAALPASLPRPARLVLAAVAVRAGFLFLAIGAPSLFTTIIKRMIGRGRPLVSGVADPYLYSPFIWRVEYSSLPSGHATTAFAALVAIGAIWPRTRAVMWIYALVIAASRVIIVAHHPSDVVTGALVGAVGAIMVRHYFAARGLGFTLSADGGVRPMPGPSLRRIKAVARALLA